MIKSRNYETCSHASHSLPFIAVTRPLRGHARTTARRTRVNPRQFHDCFVEHCEYCCHVKNSSQSRNYETCSHASHSLPFIAVTRPLRGHARTTARRTRVNPRQFHDCFVEHCEYCCHVKISSQSRNANIKHRHAICTEN